MLIDLVDTLRCVAQHEESWLVAAVDELRGRHLIRGALGCHVCGAEYAVSQGVLRMGDPPSVVSVAPRPADEEVAVRVQALLNLTSPGGVVVLGGAAGRWLSELAGQCDALFLQLNPNTDLASGAEVPTILCGARVPFAAASVRGVYWAGEVPDSALTMSLVTALRLGGRMVAPVATAVPSGLEEIARDSVEWVAERRSVATAPIPLTRAGYSSPLAGGSR